MSYNKFLPLATILIMAQAACTSEGDATSFTEDQLLGRWEITEAYRNGKKTETLTDTFYEFDSEGNMRTNLNPVAMPETYGYDFDGQKISQKGGTDTEFKVEELNDSTLTMSMQINEFPFRLKLHKVPAQDTSATEEGILQ